ncbi:MAG: porin family protein [Pirellulaceae bacterium]|nr:porin family protein [Pirellulaceae bacterium]
MSRVSMVVWPLLILLTIGPGIPAQDAAGQWGDDQTGPTVLESPVLQSPVLDSHAEESSGQVFGILPPPRMTDTSDFESYQPPPFEAQPSVSSSTGMSSEFWQPSAPVEPIDSPPMTSTIANDNWGAAPSCGCDLPICGCDEPSCGIDPGCCIESPCGIDPYEILGSPGCGCEGACSCDAIDEPTCGCGAMDCFAPSCDAPAGFPLGGNAGDCHCGGCDSMGSGVRCNGGVFKANRGRCLARIRQLRALFGFPVQSFLCHTKNNSCYYFSVDYGFAGSADEARHVGNEATVFGGTPLYDIHSGGMGRHAIGFDYGQFRLEAEFGVHRSSIESTLNGSGDRSSDVFNVNGYRRSSTVMVNAYYDFHNDTYWTPFVKAGMGGSRNKVKTDLAVAVNSPAIINAAQQTGPFNDVKRFPTDRSSDFAYCLGAGVAVDLTSRVKFDVEYQFLDIGDSATLFDSNFDAISFGGGGLHELAFGLRFYR